MRLLRTDTLAIEDFFDGEVPPYAILSHTWEAEEVTFGDVRSLALSHPNGLNSSHAHVVGKKGFAKLKGAAGFARQNSHKYIWIDTCCIDKSSSAELLEAINSMYTWYRDSEVCYAFLPGVPPATVEDPIGDGSAVRRSRWFTRGWTLQEMIAPFNLVFLARDWSVLGTKQGDTSFTKMLSEITGVPVPVLQGRVRPRDVSVATRMKWASSRETTRREDIAYCMLGLFEVNMPLLYGEGHKAFIRLQEEILKRTSDQSIFAWNRYDDAEEDPDEVCGLFAHSPLQFRECGGIERLPLSATTESVPVEMTSHGLRVQLYLRPCWNDFMDTEDEDYYALLDCIVVIGSVSYCPTIWLRRLGFDQFGRLYAKSRKLLPPVDYQYPNYIEGYHSIYVRQEPTYYSLPEFKIQPSGPYQLQEAFPDAQWNPVTLTLTATFSRSTDVLGLFRYVNEGTEQVVDVAVGLTKIDGLRWEPWCFQRRYTGVRLATIFRELNAEIRQKNGAKTGPSHWFGLQTLFGHDHRLMSVARVDSLQLHHRSYVSLFLREKVEICTSRELTSVKRAATGLVAEKLKEIETRSLTAAAAIDVVDEDDDREISEIRGVRRRPDGIDDDYRLVDRFRTFWSTPSTSASSKAQTRPRSSNRRLLSHLQPVWSIPFGGHSQRIEEAKVLLAELAARARLRLLASPSSTLERDILKKWNPMKQDPVSSELKIYLNTIYADAKALRELASNPEDLPLTHADSHGWTVLHIAAAMGLEDHIKWILQRVKTESALTELLDSRTSFLLESPLHLLAAYAPISQQVVCFQAISSFISTGYEAVFARSDAYVRLDQFAHLATRNALDETILHRAAISNNESLISFIVSELKRRNSGHNRSNEVQSLVSTYGSDFILEADCLDKFGRSPVWHAASVGACASIAILLGHGAKINLVDDEGLTPLHAACREGRSSAVQLLLTMGASPHIETSTLNLTPLHYAALYGHVDCVRALLNAGVNVNKCRGMSPIHVAVAGGSLACVSALAEAGAWCAIPCKVVLEPVEDENFAKLAPGADNSIELASRLGRTEVTEYLRGLKQDNEEARRQQMTADQELNSRASDVQQQSERPDGPNLARKPFHRAPFLMVAERYRYGSGAAAMIPPMQPFIPYMPYMPSEETYGDASAPAPDTAAMPQQPVLHTQADAKPTQAQTGGSAGILNYPPLTPAFFPDPTSGEQDGMHLESVLLLDRTLKDLNVSRRQILQRAEETGRLSQDELMALDRIARHSAELNQRLELIETRRAGMLRQERAGGTTVFNTRGEPILELPG